MGWATFGVKLAVAFISIHRFLLKQGRSTLLQKEPGYGDEGNGQQDNQQPPGPKSLRILPFMVTIREDTNPDIESMERRLLSR